MVKCKVVSPTRYTKTFASFVYTLVLWIFLLNNVLNEIALISGHICWSDPPEDRVLQLTVHGIDSKFSCSMTVNFLNWIVASREASQFSCYGH